MESQIKVLARDSNENKANPKKATILTVDPDLLKGTVFPSLSSVQQQPHLAYNPNTGMLVSGAPVVSGLKPVVIGADQNQQRLMVMPYQSPKPQEPFHPNTSQFLNPQPNLSGNVQPQFALKPRNLNHTYPQNQLQTSHNPFQPSLVQPLAARPSGVFQHVSYPTPGAGPAPANFTSGVRYPGYSLPSFEEKGNHFTTGANPFSYDAPYINPAHPKLGHTGAPMYGTKSTGGKGRRQHLPARRKGGYGSVSAGTPSIKFTFEDFKHFPSTSTSKDSKTSNNRCGSDEQVLLLSSARESKSSGKEKKPATPETLFDVEAEDRYWDALSTKTQNQTNQ